ncbi:MAG: metallophosphoesterase family protein, partial [Pirellulaceae bacterium]
THIPGIFTEGGKFLSPESIDHKIQLGDEKMMINIGSVGRPRDENRRACYAVLDLDERIVEYHRVEYDYTVTAKKIYDIPQLDNMLGDRLSRGN